MSDSHSDALIFFGATGDLAHKKIFPSLQAMLKRGHLDVPVIGVAKSGWNLDQFRARARDSLEKDGGLDSAAFNKLCGLLRYVDGDYNDPATYQSIRKELGSARRPAHYLAIPPVLFGLVVEQLGKSGCAEGARVIVSRWGPTSLQRGSSTESYSAHSTRRRLSASIITSGSGRCITCCTSASRIRFWSRSGIATMSRAWRSPWRRISASSAAAPSTATGAIRDVIQNHLFQVMTNLAIEPPVRTDSESIRDEKVEVLKAISPVGEKDVIRGQFRGYRTEKGVAPDSKVETFAALRLEINSWRWQGVPFYIRAGKCLPATCTEILVRLRRPPTVYPSAALKPNHMRLQVSPEVTIFLGMTRPSTNISRAPGVPARSIGGSPRRTAGINRP